MRKPVYLTFLLAVLLMSTGSLYAADLKDGFFDMENRPVPDGRFSKSRREFKCQLFYESQALIYH